VCKCVLPPGENPTAVKYILSYLCCSVVKIVLFGCYLCCSKYCLCVNVYCHRVTTQLQLNILYHICAVRLLFVLFYVLFVCKCVLPPGDNPTAVKYIISYLCFSVVICVVRLLFVLFYVLFVCKCVLPPGDNPIAVKYISYLCCSVICVVLSIVCV
jgi:hypothetical protein